MSDWTLIIFIGLQVLAMVGWFGTGYWRGRLHERRQLYRQDNAAPPTYIWADLHKEMWEKGEREYERFRHAGQDKP